MKREVFVFLLIFFSLVNNVKAEFRSLCEKGSFLDIFFDIRWEALFPISIAGVKIKGPKNSLGDPPGTKGGRIICLCKKDGKVVLGTTVSYWNPVRAVETTKIPWCISTFQKFLNLGNYWKSLGSFTNQADTTSTFTNVHNIKFNVLDVLNLFVDVPCVPHEGLDIAYFSEIDPTWNNSIIAYFIHPEAILFANPVAQMACAADAATSVVDWPIDALFWCAGSWGGVYPFVGYNQRGNYIQGNVLNMARLLYKEVRTGVSWDTGIDECGAVIVPIWVKSHFKFHQLKPVRGPVLSIGRPTLLWEGGANPPGGTSKGSADNFSWVIWKFVKCCMGYSQ